MVEFDYDGALDIERAWREGLMPDPLLTVSEWADRHRMLSSKASAEPGRWRTSRTPYLKAIMDCLSPTSPVAASHCWLWWTPGTKRTWLPAPSRFRPPCRGR